MDVPVAIFRDVCGDRSTDVVRVQPFVLVVEDVVAVALEVGVEVGIPGLVAHLRERQCVVLTYRTCDVVE